MGVANFNGLVAKIRAHNLLSTNPVCDFEFDLKQVHISLQTAKPGKIKERK